MDIENKIELSTYLSGKEVIAPDSLFHMRTLAGGVSCKSIWIESNREPLIIKQALSKLKTKADWYSDPRRLRIESEGLLWMNKYLPGFAPRQVFFDGQHFILGMEGVKEPNKNLKHILLKGDLPNHLIKKLGTLLGEIHRLGKGDEETKSVFNDRSYFINLRVEPYYEYSITKLPESKGFFESLISDTLNITETLVHGDFSPKNVLVKEDNLILLDYEVMHFGDPAFDVGFVLCHLLSKANYHGSSAFVDAALMLWQNYQSVIKAEHHGFESRCVRHLLGCMIARVHGRSPLEYLSESQKNWQSTTAMKLMQSEHQTFKSFFTAFKQELDGHNH